MEFSDEGLPASAPRIRIGDELLRRGLITDTQLQVALAEQRRVHRPLGEILVSLGFVQAIETARLLSEQLGLPLVRPDDIEPEAMILAALDPDLIRTARAFPISIEGGTLRVAMVDPTDPRSIDAVRAAFPYPLSILMVTAADLDLLLRRHAGGVATNEVAEILALGTSANDDRRIHELSEAVVRDGIRRGATDIHIQPEEFLTRVRYRIDGVLRSAESLPKDVSDAVVSRLKINARLDIAERRRPQDGRVRAVVDGRDVDLRMSVMPNVCGENIVLRVLDRSGGVPPLEQLGVDPDIANELGVLAERPHGLFLVTGPTGSGKTTTLYALLSRVDSIQRNVATIEDPVEYSVPLVRQSQVDTAVGYGFHEGLRALLRQDPDVILVGEIRDEITADMAIKAAMTGHLVLATLHTIDALGAIPRLVDLGVPSYLLQDTLLASMSQRLVRRLCDRCAAPLTKDHDDYELTHEWIALELGESADLSGLRTQIGCSACDESGYSGRLAVAEIFMPDELSRPFIRMAESAVGPVLDAGQDPDVPRTLEQAAYAGGFKDLGHDAALKVVAGVTTLSEVLRIHRPKTLGAAPEPSAKRDGAQPKADGSDRRSDDAHSADAA